MREEKRININSINTYRKFKSKIDKIKSPVLIVSGKNDGVVAHFHSILLLEKAVNLK